MIEEIEGVDEKIIEVKEKISQIESDAVNYRKLQARISDVKDKIEKVKALAYIDKTKPDSTELEKQLKDLESQAEKLSIAVPASNELSKQLSFLITDRDRVKAKVYKQVRDSQAAAFTEAEKKYREAVQVISDALVQMQSSGALFSYFSVNHMDRTLIDEYQRFVPQGVPGLRPSIERDREVNQMGIEYGNQHGFPDVVTFFKNRG